MKCLTCSEPVAEPVAEIERFDGRYAYFCSSCYERSAMLAGGPGILRREMQVEGWLFRND